MKKEKGNMFDSLKGPLDAIDGGAKHVIVDPQTIMDGITNVSNLQKENAIMSNRVPITVPQRPIKEVKENILEVLGAEKDRMSKWDLQNAVLSPAVDRSSFEDAFEELKDQKKIRIITIGANGEGKDTVWIPLSKEEQALYDKLNLSVEHNYRKVFADLNEILQQRLYRDEFSSWETFLFARRNEGLGWWKDQVRINKTLIALDAQGDKVKWKQEPNQTMIKYLAPLRDDPDKLAVVLAEFNGADRVLFNAQNLKVIIDKHYEPKPRNTNVNPPPKKKRNKPSAASNKRQATNTPTKTPVAPIKPVVAPTPPLQLATAISAADLANKKEDQAEYTIDITGDLARLVQDCYRNRPGVAFILRKLAERVDDPDQELHEATIIIKRV